MSLFIVTFGILLLFIGGMSIGVIFGKAPLKGSCGGLNKITGDKCQFCDKADECKEKRKK